MITNKVQPGDGDKRHGRHSTYVNHRCRCEPCRDANRKWQAEHRTRLRGAETPGHVHGTTNGYLNYGCRCRECTSAAGAATRAHERSVREELIRLRAENAELKARVGA